MSPEEKKLEKLNKLFEMVNADFATPDDLIKLSEALLGVITNEKERLDSVIAEKEGKASRETAKALAEISKLETRFSNLVNKLQSDSSITLSKATQAFQKEIKRLEKKIPTRTDLSGLEAEIAGIKDSFNTLPTELTMNNEAIRDGLELLPDGEKLVTSAIEDKDGKNLDDIIEELKSKGKNSNIIAGVRLLRYLADVNIEGITNGQTIVWDSASGKFIPSSGGSGSGIVETIVAGTGISVDSTDPANPIVSATGGGAVDSVNGQTGVVVLDAGDVGAYTTAEVDTLLLSKQDEAVVVSSNQTATNDSYYVTVANATYTDPSPVEGKGFIVFVRNGTATVGGTGYGTAGTVIHRIFHSGAWANYVYQVSSTFALASHTHTASEVTDFSTASDARIAAAAGVSIASLSGGKVPTSQLPALALTDVFTVASQVAQLALTAEEGDVAIRTDQNKSYIHNGGVSGTMTDWSELLTPTDTVLSVNGEVGAVTLTTDDISDTGQTNKWATASEKTKLGHITVTQAVDLDTIESDTATNNAKVTNATHTGDVTGSGALTIDPTAISGKTLKTTLAGTEEVLINEAGTLKKTTAQDIANLGGVGSGISEELAIVYAVVL